MICFLYINQCVQFSKNSKFILSSHFSHKSAQVSFLTMSLLLFCKPVHWYEVSLSSHFSHKSAQVSFLITSLLLFCKPVHWYEVSIPPVKNITRWVSFYKLYNQNDSSEFLPVAEKGFVLFFLTKYPLSLWQCFIHSSVHSISAASMSQLL